MYFGKGHVLKDFTSETELKFSRVTYSSDLLTIGKHISCNIIFFLPSFIPQSHPFTKEGEEGKHC